MTGPTDEGLCSFDPFGGEDELYFEVDLDIDYILEELESVT